MCSLNLCRRQSLKFLFYLILTLIKNFNTSLIAVFWSFSGVIDVDDFLLTLITLKLFKLTIKTT